MALPKASDNPFPSVLFVQQGSDPTTPSTGDWRLYFKSGGLYAKNDAGTVVGPFVTSSGAGAWTQLDATTLGSPASSYSKGSLTTTGYNLLVLEWVARMSTAGATLVQLTLNSDTAGHYDYEQTSWQSTAGSALAGAAQSSFGCGGMGGSGAGTGKFSNGRIIIVNPGSTSLQRVIRSENIRADDETGSNFYLQFNFGWWRDATNAVTTVTLTPQSGNFATGSKFTLWGVT